MSTDDQKLINLNFYNNGQNTFPEISTNLFAWYQLNTKAAWYQELETEMEQDKNFYQKEVYKWLGLEFNPETTDSTTYEKQFDVEKNIECSNSLRQVFEVRMCGKDFVTISTDDAQKLEAELFDIIDRYELKYKDINIKRESSRNRSVPNINNIAGYFGLPFTLSKKKNNEHNLTRTKSPNIEDN